MKERPRAFFHRVYFFVRRFVVRFEDDVFDFFRDVFLFGTLSPSRRASERPIATACLRLFTFLPLRPDLSVPRLYSRMTFLTFLEAAFPYFAI